MLQGSGMGAETSPLFYGGGVLLFSDEFVLLCSGFIISNQRLARSRII